MNKTTVYILAVICLLFAVLTPSAIAAQGDLSVTNSGVIIDYPMNLEFSSDVSSNVNVTDIRLRFSIEQMSFADVFSEGYVVFTPSRAVNARYSLDMRKIGGFPPGSVINYWWFARDASGKSIETEPIKYVVNDNRYIWKNITQGKISLYWYNGDDSFAMSLMDTAQNTLAKVKQDTGADPEQTISIYIYGNSNDLRSALIYPQEWTGGVAFTSYRVIVIEISTSQLSWGKRAMTHELTHQIVHQDTLNPYNYLPVWLNEGLAVHSEGELTSQYSEPLKKAVLDDELLSLRSLCSPFSAYSDISLLSYAESYSVVDYLIQTYGPAKMKSLLNTFKQGSTYANAFQSIYGLSIESLDSQWQSWIKQEYAKN